MLSDCLLLPKACQNWRLFAAVVASTFAVLSSCTHQNQSSNSNSSSAAPVRLCLYQSHNVVPDGPLELIANLVALIDQRHNLQGMAHGSSMLCGCNAGCSA
jgi:hypothetical protein